MLVIVCVLVTFGAVFGQVVGRDSSRGLSRLPCFPSGFTANELVKAGSTGRSKTIGERLAELKARCRYGKLVDRNNREIRFYRDACWGNPPADYLDILDKQRREIARLKKRFTVIEIGCDPRTVVLNSFGPQDAHLPR